MTDINLTHEEAAKYNRDKWDAAVKDVETFEKAIAEEIQRDKDSKDLHTRSMRELRTNLTAARAVEVGWRKMLPRERTPKTVTPSAVEPSVHEAAAPVERF